MLIDGNTMQILEKGCFENDQRISDMLKDSNTYFQISDLFFDLDEYRIKQFNEVFDAPLPDLMYYIVKS